MMDELSELDRVLGFVSDLRNAAMTVTAILEPTTAKQVEEHDRIGQAAREISSKRLPVPRPDIDAVDMSNSADAAIESVQCRLMRLQALIRLLVDAEGS